MIALKIILIYVKGCEKRNPIQILKDMHVIRFEKSNFVILDRYSLCRVLVVILDMKDSIETSVEF